jgi:hypothetical protein
MSSPSHKVFSKTSYPVVTLRRDHESPSAPSWDYVPPVLPTRKASLIPDSALARLGLLAGCLSVWLVVAVELLNAPA